MNAHSLLTHLTRNGATFRAIGDRIHVQGPSGIITPEMLDAVKKSKTEILSLLKEEAEPTGGAPVPSPPEHWSPGQRIDSDMVIVFERFADNGTQPAWDDLIGAARLEHHRGWCEETLAAVYSGQMTLWIGPDGRVMASPRGEAS